MSKLEFDDDNDPEYKPHQSIRNSFPCKKAANSSKLIEPEFGFMKEPSSPPRRTKKKSTKSKNNNAGQDNNTGRWSKEEHDKFLKAIKIYGRDWK
jgi:hypothetical protein